jgi:lysophospholipase L1-like esterase
MNEKLRNGLVNAGLVVMSVVVFFAALEGYFVVFNPQIQAGSCQYDEILGWEHKPNFDGIRVTKEFETHIKINSKGLRDKNYDYEKTDGIKRIVVLGDSMAEGAQVEENERFTEVLENSLLKNTQIINTGVSGYSNSQELLFLKNEGMKYNPDIVLVAFCISNDVRDNMENVTTWDPTQGRPVFILNDNELTLTNVPVPQKKENVTLFLVFKRYMARHFHSYAFISTKISMNPNLLNFFKKIGIAGAIRENPPRKPDLYSNTCTPKLHYGWNLTKAILKEMNAVAKENNSKTLIVLIPSKEQVYKENWDRIKRYYTLNDQNYNLSKPNDVLVEFGEESDIPFLDLLPEFRKYAENDEQLYFKIDGHWNANGHKHAAELIYDKLIEEELILLGGER